MEELGPKRIPSIHDLKRMFHAFGDSSIWTHEKLRDLWNDPGAVAKKEDTPFTFARTPVSQDIFCTDLVDDMLTDVVKANMPIQYFGRIGCSIRAFNAPNIYERNENNETEYFHSSMPEYGAAFKKKVDNFYDKYPEVKGKTLAFDYGSPFGFRPTIYISFPENGGTSLTFSVIAQSEDDSRIEYSTSYELKREENSEHPGHMAMSVYAKDDAGDVQRYVIDPVYCNEPLTVDDWIEKIGAPKDRMVISSEMGDPKLSIYSRDEKFLAPEQLEKWRSLKNKPMSWDDKLGILTEAEHDDPFHPKHWNACFTARGDKGGAPFDREPFDVYALGGGGYLEKFAKRVMNRNMVKKFLGLLPINVFNNNTGMIEGMVKAGYKQYKLPEEFLMEMANGAKYDDNQKRIIFEEGALLDHVPEVDQPKQSFTALLNSPSISR